MLHSNALSTIFSLQTYCYVTSQGYDPWNAKKEMLKKRFGVLKKG